MHDERAHFALSCRDSNAPAPVLTGVQAEGRLDAVLFELTVRQTYRNTSDQLLEVVYTFPLPPQAVLLGFASELNGERQGGVIVAKREAERQYEESLEEGDAPVMLEAHRDGLHTANIGNLKPGDEIVLEARFAQLLGFEQGRLRVSIPTTIAPRYGHAEQAGLQPQQVPLARLDAEYPLALTLTIGEALAGAGIECPTHPFAIGHGEHGTVRLDLAAGACLDRDVVVIVTPREPRPSLLVRADNPFDASAPVLMMAALQPPNGAPRERIALKLLVDCSGSMNGDSIASARAALRGVVAGLSERDHLSLSRFGSTVEHLLAPSLATPQALRHLQPLIDGIQADLGGTEMDAALGAVFELHRSAEHGGADVLLITDGEIWRAEEMIAAAHGSGHRVFAIGVGSAPAEGVLRALAESTGGACEFATPGEALEAAARRMLHRIRQPVLTNVRIDWRSTPAWTSDPAPCVFGGDTVIALAGFKHPIEADAIRLLADDAQGKTVELARGEADAPCPGDSLPRLAAARRISQTADADALALALQYRLMSTQTNCILVHQRAEADKATEQAEIHRVSSMVAAGWGGLGTVRDATLGYSLGSRVMSSRTRADTGIRFCLAYDDIDRPAFLRKVDTEQRPASLETTARSIGNHLAQGGQIQELPSLGESMSLHADVRLAIDDVVRLGLSVEQAWLLLAHWTNTRTSGLSDQHLAGLLQPLVALIDPTLAVAATQVFERKLGGYAIDDWTLSRVQRLRRALRIGT
ncbi:MAG: VWA domain-containing protein [Burkholderiaceae bacterium]|nr:MAG: VWA domain-containing protein [Burkholderiaceae bacterium]